MSLLNTLLYLVLPAAALIYLFVRRKLSYWADRNVPHAPGSFPMGSLQGMGTKYHMSHILERIYQQFKNESPAVGFYLTMKPTLMVTDLELVKQVLVKDFNSFRDRGVYYNEKDDPVSAHLFAIDGEKWRFLRNKLSPTFTSGKIKYMFNTMQEIGDEFVECFGRYEEREEAVDVKTLCGWFTCDVIGSCAFGLNCNSLKNEESELITIANRLFKPSPIDAMWQFFFMSFRDLSAKLRLLILPRDIAKYFMTLIPETVTYREQNNVTRPDFLQLLIQLKNKGTVDGAEQESSGETLTMNQVVAQSFVFMLGGFETTSTALTFALFELANNPEIQEKVRVEVSSVLARHDGKITYDALKEMTYLEQVVNETLRMYPPVPFVARNSNHSYHITNPDVTLDADTMVLVPVYAIHYDPDIYQNPTRFDPDRFTPEAIQARHTHATTFKMRSLPAAVEKFFIELVHDTVRQREKNNVQRNDFMNLLIQLKNSEDPDARITMDEITAQSFVFFLAGSETSSTAMVNCMYELAMNQDIQDKLRNEITRVCGKGKLTYEAVNSVEYLNMVIDETLRKHPSVDFLMRTSNSDFPVPNSDLTIPKGTFLIVPTYALQHDPDHYPDPDRFDPERFNETNRASRHPFVYLPFGEGPRNCIGMRFGLMQIRVGLITMLREFRVLPGVNTPVPLELDVTSNMPMPKGGVPLLVERI